MAEISVLSSEFVFVVISFTDPVTGLQVDPTGDTVQLAFTTSSTVRPQSGDWISASWRVTGGQPPYVAQTLVGPLGHVLAVGGWQVWAKIVSNPELPVLRCGFLKVT